MPPLFSAPLNWVRNSQVWNSIFRHGVPRDRRTRVMAVMSNVFLHLHPVAVRKSGIRLSFTWCMGGLTFFLFLAETVSGVLLMFYYRPVIEYAYQDIQDLRAHVTLGPGSGLVLAQPVPIGAELDGALHDRLLEGGLDQLTRRGVTGKEVTPALLEHFHSGSGGEFGVGLHLSLIHI